MKSSSLLSVISVILILLSCGKGDDNPTPTPTTGGTLFWTDSKTSIENCGTLTVTVDGSKTTTIATSSSSEPTNCVNQTGIGGQGGYLLLEQGTHNYTVTSSNGCLSTSGTVTITPNSCNKIKISAPVSLIGTWKKVSDETIDVDSASNPPSISSDVFNDWEGTLVFKSGNNFSEDYISTNPPLNLHQDGTYTLSTSNGKSTLRLVSPVNDVTVYYTVTDTELTTTSSNNVSGTQWKVFITKYQRQ